MRRAATFFDEEVRMPFGKHKGEPLSEIERPYLGYVLTMPDVRPELADAVRDELRNRGLGFGRFKDRPLSELPAWYLRWLVNEDFLVPPWDELVEEELKRRRAA